MRFELPTISSLPTLPTLPALPTLPGDVTAKLTDAGHTAVGFAAMAAKQANDSRLELNGRFEPRVRDLRKNAVGTVKSVSAARLRLAETVDPIVDRMVERLPDTVAETIADTVAEVRKVSRQTAHNVELRVIEAIEFATAIPAKPVRRSTQKTAAATGTKVATAKKAVKSSSAKTVKTAAAVKTASTKGAATVKASAQANAKKATKTVQATAKTTAKTAKTTVKRAA